jgi:arylsulfatase A-like enzyme
VKKSMALGMIAFALLLLSGAARCEEAAEVKPGAYAGCNVLLVSFDALQAAHTHCLGYPRPVTPAIDSFAGDGFLFENAAAQSSWTVPSHMSYFTSRYPSQHKVVNKYSVYTDTEKVFSNLQQLSPGTATLAEVLKENGYATGGFTGDAGVGAKFGFGAGFDEYFEGPRFGATPLATSASTRASKTAFSFSIKLSTR